MVNRSSSMCPAHFDLFLLFNTRALSLLPSLSFLFFPLHSIYLHNCQTFVATDELALSAKRRVRECYAVCVRVCVCVGYVYQFTVIINKLRTQMSTHTHTYAKSGERCAHCACV